jgi:hypothetical protein
VADTQTHVFRASLDSKTYRDFEMLSAKSLYQLADAIVGMFGFDFDHPFGFYSKLKGNFYDSPVRYELFFDIGEPNDPPGLPASRSVEKTRIADAFPEVGDKMRFMFDYGDERHFQLEVIGRGRKEAKVRYPRLVKSVGKAPEQYPRPDEEGIARSSIAVQFGPPRGNSSHQFHPSNEFRCVCHIPAQYAFLCEFSIKRRLDLLV